MDLRIKEMTRDESVVEHGTGNEKTRNFQGAKEIVNRKNVLGGSKEMCKLKKFHDKETHIMGPCT